MCVREGGIPAGTYVQDYLGELYTPWRWYERQDAIKKREPGKALPDFFNITLERPKEDAAGVDTIFVEAAHRCTFASRLSHSCAPNVQTVVLAVASHHRAVHHAHIEYGEELCWNYSRHGEREGVPRGDLPDAVQRRVFSITPASARPRGDGHAAAPRDRNAVLIRARAPSRLAGRIDRAAPRRAGVKSAALCMAGDVVSDDGGDAAAAAATMTNADKTHKRRRDAERETRERVPRVAGEVGGFDPEYIETEKALLPDALMEVSPDGITYDRAFAEATAAAAATPSTTWSTLEEIKYVMRQLGSGQGALRPLRRGDRRAPWLGPHGIFRRAVDAMAASGGGLSLGGKGSSARRRCAGLRLKHETQVP